MIKKLLKKILKRSLVEKYPIYIPTIEGQFLKDRTILVTGGSSGIGYAIAEASIKNGATVIITGRDQEKLDDASTKLKKIEENSVYSFVFDISEADKINEKFKEVLDNIGGRKIDVLVNNAGVNSNSPFGSTSIEEYDRILNTNLKGTYFLSQVVSNYMIENKIQGNIINIASSSSLRPVYNPYSLSKWGDRGLTIGMAKKLIKYGIVVNGIAPGATATPMQLKYNSDEDIALDTSPIERYITSEEIANLAVFLMSNMGRAIVGDIIYITGGAGTITVDDINY